MRDSRISCFYFKEEKSGLLNSERDPSVLLLLQVLIHLKSELKPTVKQSITTLKNIRELILKIVY